VTVNVACAGAGWAMRERHLPSLARDPRVRLLGIVDPHPERARAIAERFSIPNWSTSLDEPWAADVQCLTVGSPPWTHGDLVETALERGWHCLSEKPFVTPSARGAELAERADELGLVLAVVHNFQFSRAGCRLFELVDSGRLGAIEAVHGFQLSNPRRRLPHWVSRLPGGLFYDETPHLLYLTRRILGRLDVLSAMGRAEGDELRGVSVAFEHDSVWSTLTMTFNASVFEWQLVVVGSEAVAAFDIVRDVLVVLPNDGSHKARDVLRSSSAMIFGHARGFASSGLQMVRRRLLYGNDEACRRFVDAVEGNRDRIAGMTGHDGTEVVACLEQILDRVGLETRSRAYSA
jgi:predicted dehydrogenase